MTNDFDNWKIREGDVLKNSSACYLTNTDLIAYVLQDHDKANSILDNHKCLRQLEALERGELEQILGSRDAERLIASIELGKRIQKEQRPDSTRINSAKELFELYRDDIAHLTYEQFVAVLFDVKNTILDSKVLFKGGINSSVVDPKIVYKYAMAYNASSFIAIHNHPSGYYEPSNPDIRITKQLAEGGEILQVRLLDHIIISDKGFYSFRISQPDILY